MSDARVAATPVRRACGIERRQQIIDATLRIIIREGIRAVRHRAVAAEAGVPLASTTYYFADLKALLNETFAHWTQKTRLDSDAFQARVFGLLADLPPLPLDKLHRERLATALVEATYAFTIDQVENHADDRVVELAFQHEALRDPTLGALVLQIKQHELNGIIAFHQLLHSDDPEVDAQITLSVLLRLEQQAVIEGAHCDRQKLKRTLARYIGSVVDRMSEQAPGAEMDSRA